MINHADLKKGIRILFEGQPYEILEARSLKMAQRRVVIQAKIKNLINGNVCSRNFHQGDVFQEANLSKIEAKFLYFRPDRPRPKSSGGATGASRNRYFFCEKDNPAKRFDLNEKQIDSQVRFLKQGQVVEGILFENKIINISLPIKIQLKVTEAPPGVRGERAQSGTKTVTLETGAKINVPLFIGQDDIVEINTEAGEYVRRIE